MHKPIGNRDKRIAILLIAAFAWLFIGSLILFHQEHVLGKHIRLNSQMFISPKSKDKQGLTVKLQQPVQNSPDHVGFTGILTQDCRVSGLRIYFELKPKETSSFSTDDVLLTFSPLRAPPVA